MYGANFYPSPQPVHAHPSAPVCPPLYAPGHHMATYKRWMWWTIGTLVVFFGLFIPLMVVAAFSAIGAGWGTSTEAPSHGLVAVAMTVLLGMLAAGIVATVAYATLLYQAWRQIEPYGNLAPATAVALALIPGVNLIGHFFAHVGLASAQSRYLSTHRQHSRNGAGIAMADAIVLLGVLIAAAWPLFAVTWLILRFIMLHSLAEMADRVASHAAQFAYQNGTLGSAAYPVVVGPTIQAHQPLAPVPFAAPIGSGNGAVVQQQQQWSPQLQQPAPAVWQPYYAPPPNHAAQQPVAPQQPIQAPYIPGPTHPLPGGRIPAGGSHRHHDDDPATGRLAESPNGVAAAEGEWQPIRPFRNGQPVPMYRLPVPGGWWVSYRAAPDATRTFYADPSHSWDARNVPPGLG